MGQMYTAISEIAARSECSRDGQMALRSEIQAQSRSYSSAFKSRGRERSGLSAPVYEPG
jgi:hypothetical protein